MIIKKCGWLLQKSQHFLVKTSSVQTKWGKPQFKEKRGIAVVVSCIQKYMHVCVHTMDSVYCFLTIKCILNFMNIYQFNCLDICRLPISLPEWRPAEQLNINESRWPERRRSRTVINPTQSLHNFSNKLVGPQHIARMYWLLPSILYEVIIVVSQGPRQMTEEPSYLGGSSKEVGTHSSAVETPSTAHRCILDHH